MNQDVGTPELRYEISALGTRLMWFRLLFFPLRKMGGENETSNWGPQLTLRNVYPLCNSKGTLHLIAHSNVKFFRELLRTKIAGYPMEQLKETRIKKRRDVFANNAWLSLPEVSKFEILVIKLIVWDFCSDHSWYSWSARPVLKAMPSYWFSSNSASQVVDKARRNYI